MEKKLTVLIADDNHENIRELIDILKKEGFSVQVATNTERAMESSESAAWDLILLDVKTLKRNDCELIERKESREQLQKLSQAVEQGSSSVMIINQKGEIEYVNRAFTKITGYEIEEVIGENSSILKSGLVEESVYKELWTTIHNGETWRGELLNKKKDGTLFWEYESIAPIFNDEGIITHYVAVKEDITERKIMEIDLTKAKEKAEIANRIKSDFLANMSHEIRTPMNAIIGLSLLALDTELSEKQREYIKKINTSSKNLLGIINEILDFSKIEAGKLTLETIPFDLNSIVEHVTNIIHLKANEKGLHFDIQIDDDVPMYLNGDSLRIGQVLLNLTNNAIKFTEQGYVGIRIEKLKRSNSHVVLKFSVVDTGIGLTYSQKSRLFMSFEQADTSITRKHGGTGLGLSICKRVVEMMGGKISVDTEYGVGSTFSFVIELEIVGEEEIPQYYESDMYTKVINRIRGAHILLVEDNEINQLVAKDLLEKEGFRIIIASNGKIAVDMVASQEEKFELILMDLQMPIMDGYTASNLIREQFSKEELPIIALTADAMSGVRERISKFGMNDYVTKPIDRELLLKVLSKWVSPRYKSQNESNVIEEVDNAYKLPFNSLENIVIERGLMHLNGNKELYLKLLNKFYKNNLELIADIQDGVKHKEYERVHRLVHTLKSVSGSIGAVSLQNVSEQFEAALIGFDEENYEKLIELLERELNIVISSIEPYILKSIQDTKSTSTSIPSEEGTIEELLLVLADLLPEVEKHKLSASKKKAKLLGSKVWAKDKIADVDNIVKYLKEYEFDHAEEIILKIISSTDNN